MGAAISKAGAERTTPLATATLVLAANAPDIDVLSYARGPFFALSFRRGITHGWPALILMSFGVAALVVAWDRWVRRRLTPDADPVRAGPTLALSAVGLLTHPTLDWMNTYGMRWAMPFDGSWSYGDALFVIDPWIWLVLGSTLFLASRPGRRRLAGWTALGAAATILVWVAAPSVRMPWIVGIALVVASRVLGLPGSYESRRLAAGASIMTVAAYMGVLVALDGVARRQVVDVAGRQGVEVLDVMVAPVRGDPFASDVVLVTAEAYVPGTHRWLGALPVELLSGRAVPRLSYAPSIDRARAAAIVEVARTRPDVRHYLDWSRYPHFRVEPDADGWTVAVSDARYDGVAEAGSLGGLTVRVGAGMAR